MPRFFNTAGPCRPGEHYMLLASARVPEVRRVVERGGYFVLHAPRQTGKTTALLQLAQELTAEGLYAACLFGRDRRAVRRRHRRHGRRGPGALARRHRPLAGQPGTAHRLTPAGVGKARHAGDNAGTMNA